MDFGAFIVFGLAAIATLAFLPVVIAAFVRRHPFRRPLLGGLGLMAAFLVRPERGMGRWHTCHQTSQREPAS